VDHAQLVVWTEYTGGEAMMEEVSRGVPIKIYGGDDELMVYTCGRDEREAMREAVSSALHTRPAAA
jgi:hypothetical protein